MYVIDLYLKVQKLQAIYTHTHNFEAEASLFYYYK